MSTPSAETIRPGEHVERSVTEQLACGGAREPADEPVIHNLTDDEKRGFLDAIAD